METKWHQGTTYSGSKTHAVLYLGIINRHPDWRTRAACGVRISPLDVKQRLFANAENRCGRCEESLWSRDGSLDRDS
jgi:hypothetical protein